MFFIIAYALLIDKEAERAIMRVEVGAQLEHHLLSLKEVFVLSRKPGFIPRKDLTKRSKAAADKGEQCFATTSGDVLVQSLGNSDIVSYDSKHDRPKYVSGFSPSRGSTH